jgi:gamma-glutamylcyclotransferase (GGCT)/AIG2-like uncharacterized protein YtfP
MNKVYLFVYGTLMRRIGHPKHALLSTHTTYIGEGWIQGRLYDIYSYPGAVASNETTDKVYGELYLVNNPIIFNELDDYEECSSAFNEPHEYIRTKRPVFTNNDEETIAYCYLYNWPINHFTPIKNGQYGYKRS